MRRARTRAIFAVAVVVRALFLVWNWTSWHVERQSALSSTYFREGYGISAGYGYLRSGVVGLREIDRLADRVDAGGFVATPSTAPRLTETRLPFETFHPPGMAVLIFVLHRIVRGPADWAVEVIGIVLDSIAAVLVCWLVTEALDAASGTAAGYLYALFPPAAYWSAAARSPEGLMPVCIVGAVACVWLALTRESARWLRWCSLAAVLLATTVYLRPDYLLLPVLLGLGAFMITRRFSIAFRVLATVQLLVVALMLPWAWRNHRVTGRWIFTSSAVGAQLVTGLAEYANSWGFGPTDADRASDAVAHGVAPWTSAEADAYFRSVFWQSIEQHPSWYALTIAKRIPLAVAPPLDFGFQNPFKPRTFSDLRAEGTDRYDLVRSRLAYVLRAYADVLAMAALCFASLVCTMVMFWRERARLGVCVLLFTPHLYSVGTHLLIGFDPRYLMPSIWSLLIGPGYVLAFAVRAWRGSVNAPASAPVAATAA